MKKFISALIALVAPLLLSNCGSTSAPSDADINAIASSGGSMPSLINQLRTQKGLNTLRVDSQLSQVAKTHALDMARTGKFSHTGSDGSSYFKRLADAGVSNESVKTATENIGNGSSDPALIFPAWVKSSHHRRNATQPNHTRMGVAEASGFWCVLFAE